MSNDNNNLETIRRIATELCAAHGVALYDARFVQEYGMVLRVMIEPPGEPSSGAVSLAQCQAVSRDLSTALDVAEGALPRGAYRLEVGSPGLDRPLFQLRDFERFVGNQVKIQTRRAVAGRRRFSGPLLRVQGDVVCVQQDGAEVEIPHAEIGKANLVYSL
jgi:ribosome maturation factor RimP